MLVILASFSVGRMASEIALAIGPIMTSIFSWKTRRLASLVPAVGLAWSSPGTSVIGRPMTPPLSLISLMAMSMPRRLASAGAAPGPVSGINRPILSGFDWLNAAAGSMIAAAAISGMAVRRVR